VSVAVDTTLAQLSNTLIYSAMVVYTGALGAFTTDLSVRGRRRAEAQAVLAKIKAEPVAVGAGVAGPSSEAAVTDITAEADAVLAADSRTSRAGGIAVSLTWLALALHVAGVVLRGASVSRVPWGNAYEFAITGAVVVTAVFLATLVRRDVRYLGTFVVGPVLLTLGLAVTVFYVQADQLVPALQSFWLIIHVSVAFVAAALYTLGFSTTILQLVQERREQARAAGIEPKGGRFMAALPSSAQLEGSSYSLHIIAFPLWTFTLVAGAIWAEGAWGRYWNWDPKEVWSFIIWVVYAGHLHARATRGWDGRRAAYFALAGYVCIILNFTVVNLLFKGMHSYSGL
jgi:cytochrome c-type biogenesis protein CcsB